MKPSSASSFAQRRRRVHDAVARDAFLGCIDAVIGVAVVLLAGRELRELPGLPRRGDAPDPDGGDPIAARFDTRDERVRARLVARIGPPDPLGHPLADEPRAFRWIEELDDEGRVAVLATGDLRASRAQRGEDDL